MADARPAAARWRAVARRLHFALNVEQRRRGVPAEACGGPDCTRCDIICGFAEQIAEHAADHAGGPAAPGEDLHEALLALERAAWSRSWSQLKAARKRMQASTGVDLHQRHDNAPRS